MRAERPAFARSGILAGAVAAAALVLVVKLLVPPLAGLADNGDFERLMRPAGLGHMSARSEDRYFAWMQPRFAWAERSADLSGYRTSQMLLVEAAATAGRLARARFFDIRALAAIHIGLLLAALFGLVHACRELSTTARVTAAASLVFVFTDAGYTAPFNSLYSQTASLLFLLLIAATAAEAVRRGRLDGALLPAYFLFAALFVCSKPQETVQTPLLAIFGVALAWRAAPRRRRIVALALAAALCGLSWRYFRSAENSLGWLTRYNVLFMSILPVSPDPAGDLAELGLDPAWARYAGVSPWVPDSPALDPTIRAFVEGRSGQPSPRVLLFRHPRRLFAFLGRSAERAYVLRPDDLGNYAKESGAAPLAKAPAPWSATRAHLSGLPWLLFFFPATLAAASLTYRRAPPRGRRFREGLALAVVMAGLAFGVAALGDTQTELARHLYSFAALCDLILIADIVWLMQVLALRFVRRAA